jgi:hypothetical protein
MPKARNPTVRFMLDPMLFDLRKAETGPASGSAHPFHASHCHRQLFPAIELLKKIAQKDHA